MKAEQNKIASSGVEALIQKLKDEGVAAGQQKAERIVADAQKRSEWIIQEAEREARLLLTNARAESELIKAAGEDALKLAARETLLKVRDGLLAGFDHEVIRLVGKEMAKEECLRRIILELAGRLRKESGLDDNRKVNIRIPEHAVGPGDLRGSPEQLEQDFLSRLTAVIAADLLKEGVLIEAADGPDRGLLIKLEDDNIVIDFTDETVAALLLEHLQPRFRALMQGIIK
jgi:V/A-type H+-transporting ATPase subunit E